MIQYANDKIIGLKYYPVCGIESLINNAFSLINIYCQYIYKNNLRVNSKKTWIKSIILALGYQTIEVMEIHLFGLYFVNKKKPSYGIKDIGSVLF